jgi:hypothetical protein
MSEFCREPGCFCIAKTGKFCDKHKMDNYLRRAIRPERDAWYGLAAWRGKNGLRLYKLRRNPMCEFEGCTKPATDVHHKDSSWKESGNWRLFIDLKNLESLCHGHHSEITRGETQCKSQS